MISASSLFPLFEWLEEELTRPTTACHLFP